MYPNDLWPPLELVEAALDTDKSSLFEDAGSQTGTFEKPNSRHTAELIHPLTELVQRRAAVAAKAFTPEWRPGRLVQVASNGFFVGILLDTFVQGQQWNGWFTACETSWACESDVLLEPEDDPFEPMFGVVQTWNPVTLKNSPSTQAKVVGEVSLARLEAIRAVAKEHQDAVKSTIPPEPGCIALRTVASQHLVLTGTPLGLQDERSKYQAAYRGAVARFIAYQLTDRLAYTTKFHLPELDGLSRVKAWFAKDWLVRPAFSMLAAYVMVSTVTSMNLNVATDDSVSFRSAPVVALETGDFKVKINAQATLSDVIDLMRSSGSEIVAGPDAQGVYTLRSKDAVASKAALGQSKLVNQLGQP